MPDDRRIYFFCAYCPYIDCFLCFIIWYFTICHIHQMFSSPNGNQNQNVDTQRHCILVAASNPYPLPTPVYRPQPQNIEQSDNIETQPDNRLSDAEALAKSFAQVLVKISSCHHYLHFLLLGTSDVFVFCSVLFLSLLFVQRSYQNLEQSIMRYHFLLPWSPFFLLLFEILENLSRHKYYCLCWSYIQIDPVVSAVSLYKAWERVYYHLIL